MTAGHGGGLTVSGLLGVLFVGLKLGGVLDWSWWWVTAPFWMPVAALLLLVAVAFGLHELMRRLS